MKLADARHRVQVFERNRADDTFGFGVVFSDATLGNLAAAEPTTHGAIREQFAHWDDIEIHYRDAVLRSTGHGFCGIERHRLLAVLQARAEELGVEVHYCEAIDDVEACAAQLQPDLIVAADGVASAIRTRYAEQFRPSVEMRPNKFVWLGTTVPYRAFTFLFKATAHGLFRIHAYRYAEGGSTFIAECTEATWRAAGFEHADEDQTIAILEGLFVTELAGHRLIKNRSIWRNFPAIRCGSWQARTSNGTPMVLLGDAVHTAHFSIGSGTKLAMEDAIALRDALVREPNVPNALALYEAARKPEVLAVQAAAQTSMEWFEGTERYLEMSPAQFGYSLMTRSGRVSHASMRKRDAAMTDAVESELGVAFVQQPWHLPAPTEPRAAAAEPTSTLTFSGRLWQWPASARPPAMASARAAGQRAGAAKSHVTSREPYCGPFAASVTLGGASTTTPTTAPANHGWHVSTPAGPLVVLPARAPAADIAAAAARTAVAVIIEDAQPRAAAVAQAHDALAAGASMLWAISDADPLDASLPRVAAAPLADVLRNELRVPVALLARDNALDDLLAVLMAGRADAVVMLDPATPAP